MMPHSKTDVKIESKIFHKEADEVCLVRNCTKKSLYFECRNKSDLYLWTSNVERGPSAKFMVENIQTMEELKMTGNAEMKATRVARDAGRSAYQDVDAFGEVFDTIRPEEAQ